MDIKTVSEHDYKMILLCKGHYDGPIIDKIQEYLKKDYLGNINYLNMYDLYNHLLGTLLNVVDKNEIATILKRDIPETSIRKFFNRGGKSIDELDLCNILISKLECLQMRKDGDDIYNIQVGDKTLTYSEYASLNILKKQSIMIDMDDVLVTNYFLHSLNSFLNTNYEESDFKSFYMQEKIPENRRKEFFDYFLKEDIYKHAVISDNAVEVVKDLNEKYDVFIGTSFIFPEVIDQSGVVLKYKYDFLTKNFPYLNPYNFIFLGNKDNLNMDIKIDDRLENLKGAKEKLLFTAYHNEDLSNKYLIKNGIKRVDDFQDVKKLLLNK